MKKFYAFCICCIFINSLVAQQQVYQKIKIYGTAEDFVTLQHQGVCLDHGDGKADQWFTSYFNANETGIIKKSGLKYDVLAEDARAYYQNQYNNPAAPKPALITTCPDINTPNFPVPAHFKSGSMGGFYTYAELLADLDSMTLLYPSLITSKAPIDTGLTWDGNPIYYLKISDNPAIDEAEAETYYSAVHHAREPLSMQQLVYYMWYLLENYQTDSLVKFLVDNREMYFVPMVNPDGYLYNEFTDPQGGGLWRKNRRDNLDGTFGVDLNRNYDMFWGIDDVGSSPNGMSETYRGIAPFSEPETQMLSNFINSHQFVTAMDFHTYGNHILYPWGYMADLYTPDSAVFVALADNYTKYNDYTYGTCNQTLNYVANGGSTDWLYGEQVSKGKIFDFTPECGYDFWPQPADIIDIIQGAVPMDFYSALVAGKYAKVTDQAPTILSAVNGFIPYQVLQLGLDTTGSYTVSVTGLSPQILSTGTAKTYSNLNYLQSLDDSIAYTLNGPQYNGTELKFLLTIDFGSFQLHDTLVKYFGTPTILLSDQGNNLNNWTSGTQWGISPITWHSPPASITDSPLGDYQSQDFNELITAANINLVPADRAGIIFYAKWRVESNNDYVQVLASDNGGITWTPLCGNYTHPGTFNQDPDMPVYDGLQSDWVKEEMSLNDYIGKNIKLKFLLASDFFGEMDGFYFDDLTVWSLENNVGIPQTGTPVTFAGVSPNPATTETNIFYSIPAGDQYRLIITNMLGEEEQAYVLDPALKSMKVGLENIPAGVYYFRICNGQRTLAGKQVVVMK